MKTGETPASYLLYNAAPLIVSVIYLLYDPCSLYDVEKKKVISQERLKKEMVERVKEASHEFKKASEKQMSETTKRAIRENISISNQLVRISAKNEELLSQNDSLKQKLHRTVLDRSGLEKSCHEVTRKNISQLRNIELLMKKLERTESQLRELHSEYGHFEQIQVPPLLFLLAVHLYSVVAATASSYYASL